MPLEDYFPGNKQFENYSLCFSDCWEGFESKEELLLLVNNDLTLARPIAYHLSINFCSWFSMSIPALDNMTPHECIKTSKGLLRLKTCLLRMH